ncbi:MAG: alpha/beta hydrolase [Bacteroidota bacterium]
MKTFKKIIKWLGLSIVSLLILIVLAGLAFRIFGPGQHQAAGELVDVGGFKLHVDANGEKDNQPTLVIEGGAGVSTELYHWLNEGLKDSIRVVRYDRAGIGYSDECKTARDPETIARELHTLLEKSGEEPPYILAGHSLGGPYIRLFAKLYPNEVAGLIFMDSTHPEQVERFGAPEKSSFRYKVSIWTYKALAVLGDLGILGLYDHFFGPLLTVVGLPEEINKRLSDLLKNGKFLRAVMKESQYYYTALEQAGAANDFGSIPIRVFTATKINREAYIARGIDPDKRLATRIAAHKEYTALSTNGKQILIDGNHNTIYTIKENADIINKEIMKLVNTSQSVDLTSEVLNN